MKEDLILLYVYVISAILLMIYFKWLSKEKCDVWIASIILCPLFNTVALLFLIMLKGLLYAWRFIFFRLLNAFANWLNK